MDTYTEGLVASSTSTTPTTPKTSGVVASVSGDIPLASVVEKIRIDTTALSALVGIANNKELYTEHIDNLLDYYDYQILNELANVKVGADGTYDLSNIIKYDKIKEVLTNSHRFLAL
jgi:translation initiation factor 2 gamma subunit (eIF-2gamma)